MRCHAGAPTGLPSTRIVPADDWRREPGAQVQHELARVGGILLLMGVLHTANVVALPVIGRLLATGPPARPPDDPNP